MHRYCLKSAQEEEARNDVVWKTGNSSKYLQLPLIRHQFTKEQRLTIVTCSALITEKQLHIFPRVIHVIDIVIHSVLSLHTNVFKITIFIVLHVRRKTEVVLKKGNIYLQRLCESAFLDVKKAKLKIMDFNKTRNSTPKN